MKAAPHIPAIFLQRRATCLLHKTRPCFDASFEAKAAEYKSSIPLNPSLAPKRRRKIRAPSTNQAVLRATLLVTALLRLET